MGRWIERNFMLIAFVLCAAAMFQPALFVWSKPGISFLLGVIMFGMGITLRPENFREVLRRKRLVAVGAAAQFVCMPLLAFLLCSVFRVEKEVLLGFVLLGACPGGTASNVITYLARGNVALSVSMTTVSTLLSPLLTPLLVELYAGQKVDIPVLPMLLSICLMVLFPVAAGVLVRCCLSRISDRLLTVFPPLAILCISWIIAVVIGLNRERILDLPLLIAGLVIAHNLLGLGAGYLAGWISGADARDSRTIAIEVGMQNSGLGVALATRLFTSMPLAALPGALFSLWHNLSGIAVAAWWQRRSE
ncbi:MAG: bile acid:sodium symporter family protein [Pontiellaceae bacterium]|nr:bile acid:sodium symporter family protein [Pontiellaceae bacterium]